MEIRSCIRRGIIAFFQVLLILSWLTHLQETDTYFFVYSMMACGGFFSTIENHRQDPCLSVREEIWIWLMAAVFSLSAIMGNYSLFEPFTALTNLFRLALSFLGGMSLAGNVLVYFLRLFPGLPAAEGRKSHPRCVFSRCFGSIVLINLAFLFLVAWPGVLTRDSMDQIQQIVTGQFSNVNPYWHTMTIGLFVKSVTMLTGDIHWGVAAFCVFQILFMAGCFSYVVMTLYQKGAPRWSLLAVWVVYALIPYNIVYSVTVWKDILFSGASLLMVTALYRLVCPVEEKLIRDWILFTLGAAGLCLWRTNGLLVIAMLLIVLLPTVRKNKKLVAILAAVLAAGLILCGPVLSCLGIGSSDLAEKMSIPLQQMARVCYDGAVMAEEDLEMLRTIAEPEKFAETYQSYISDPVKDMLRKSAHYDRIQKEPLPYLKLWLRMGLRHPGSYLKAWVDQTKGYWNGGYAYWITAKGVFENKLGLTARPENNYGTLFYRLMRYLELMPFMHPLLSIGLHTWLAAGCCLINRLQGRKEWLLSLPWLVILLGLLVGTPVYAEFRYAYPVMLACPLILTATFLKQPE